MIELTLTCDKCGERKSFPQKIAVAYDAETVDGYGGFIRAQEDLNAIGDWCFPSNVQGCRVKEDYLLYCRVCFDLHIESRKKEELED